MSRPLLGLDTATDRATVAIGDVASVWHHGAIEGARRQAAGLLPLVDQTLRAAGIGLDDLAGIVVGDGPGSFTGLRIGFALARGLAHERGLPVIAVPSLLAHARAGALAAGAGAAPVAACFDALRGQVFAGVFAFPPGRVETLLAPTVMTVAELLEAVPSRPVHVVGDGAVRYAEALTPWRGGATAAPLPPVAGSLIALHDIAGRPLRDPATAEPIYGRPAEAQARWEARHGRPLPHPRG